MFISLEKLRLKEDKKLKRKLQKKEAKKLAQERLEEDLRESNPPKTEEQRGMLGVWSVMRIIYSCLKVCIQILILLGFMLIVKLNWNLDFPWYFNTITIFWLPWDGEGSGVRNVEFISNIQELKTLSCHLGQIVSVPLSPKWTWK